jgi:hypothetical protein
MHDDCVPAMAENASPASVVAKVIFEAATDGKKSIEIQQEKMLKPLLQTVNNMMPFMGY